MSQWRGFYTESKNFIGYGSLAEKVHFWRGFPGAWVKFYWMVFKDWIRT